MLAGLSLEGLGFGVQQFGQFGGFGVLSENFLYWARIRVLGVWGSSCFKAQGSSFGDLGFCMTGLRISHWVAS